MIFFAPFFVFYFPPPVDGISDFIVTNITSLLLGMLISLNIYYFKTVTSIFTKNSIKYDGEKSYGNQIRRKENLVIIFQSLFSGSSLSVFSSMCSSCTLVLINALLPLIGLVASATIISIFDTYHTYLRIISILILIVSLFIASKKIVSAENNAAADNISCPIRTNRKF
jgi:hypothetical protein